MAKEYLRRLRQIEKAQSSVPVLTGKDYVTQLKDLKEQVRQWKTRALKAEKQLAALKAHGFEVPE